MLNNEDILTISINYVLEMAKSKPYNIQSLAIVNFFEDDNNSPYNNKKDYHLSYENFSEKYLVSCTRDLVYKNDYYSTREMYIISPAHYLYYTFQTFVILYNVLGNTNADFSLINYRVFYSGHISFKNTELKSIKQYSNYLNSYEKFQHYRNSYKGNKVLVLDIQSFFNSIPCERVINKIKSISEAKKCINNVNNLENFFLFNNFSSLPQMHYSIASSALSQFFLKDFTIKMSQILIEENCEEAARFVDDMYIKLPKRKHTKTINRMLNKLTYHLWKEGLNLNLSKTKVLNAQEYKKLVESKIEVISIPETNRISRNTENQISKKVSELLDNNASMLIMFFDSLNKLENTKGIDIKEYHNIVNTYISIDGEHVSKVLNSLIYGKKWKAIDIKYLEIILSNHNYIFFNPAQFTIFYLMINKHIELLTGKSKNYTVDLINFLENLKEHTFRDSIVSINIFIQNRKIKKNLLKKIERVNKNYVEFIQKYILSYKKFY